MKIQSAFILLLLLIWGQTVSAHQLPLSCSITTEHNYKLGSAISIAFALTNESDQDIQLLPWGTPLEGFFSRGLVVSYQGTDLEYQGPLIKRGAAQIQDYIMLKARSTVSNQLDLTQAYQFSHRGDYQVRYDGMIQSWYFAKQADADASNPMPNNIQQFSELSCPASSFSLEWL